MTTTTGTFEGLLAFAAALKEGHRDASGMPDSVVATRGSAPIALLQADALRTLLPEVPVLTGGLAPDVVGLVVEGVVPLVPRNPATGSGWQRGEVFALWESGEGVERGWVAEAQLVTAISRDGQTRTVGRSFRMLDGAVTWLDEVPFSNDGLLKVLATRFDVPVLDPSDIPDMSGLMTRPDGTPMIPVSQDPRIELDSIVLRLLARRLPDSVVQAVVPDAATRDEYVAMRLSESMCLVFGQERGSR